MVGSTDSEGNGSRKEWRIEVEQQGGQSEAADGSEVRKTQGTKSEAVTEEQLSPQGRGGGALGWSSLLLPLCCCWD